MRVVILLLAVASEISCSGPPMLFLRRNDKRLDITPIATALVDFPEQCLGACLDNNRCKAFNADYDNCELFDKDRCLASKELSESPGTSYYDTIAEKRCAGE